MEINPIIYIIDDEEPLVLTLKTLISKVFPKSQIFTAFNGLEAWRLLEKQTALSIIISDVYMPDLNGLQLLKKVKSSEILKNNYFILMSSNQETELNLKALQQGADDFFTKPFAIDQLLSKLRLTSRILNLQNQLKTEKEVMKNLYIEMAQEATKMRGILMKFQESRFPKIETFSQNITEAAIWLAKEMGVQDAIDLERIAIASQLICIGRLCLPDTLLKERVMISGQLKNEILAQIPEFAKAVVSTLRNHTEIAEILGHIYENYDGSGIPNGFKGWEIPIGSRIIRIVLDYLEMMQSDKTTSAKVYEVLEKESKRVYDQRIVILFDQYMAYKGLGCTFGREYSVDFKDIKEGMYLTRSIYTESGLKLIGSGIFLDKETIEKINTISHSDGIIGRVWVRK